MGYHNRRFSRHFGFFRSVTRFLCDGAREEDDEGDGGRGEATNPA